MRGRWGWIGVVVSGVAGNKSSGTTIRAKTMRMPPLEESNGESSCQSGYD